MVTTDFESGIRKPDHLSTARVKNKGMISEAAARWIYEGPAVVNLHTQGKHAFQVVAGEDTKGDKGL